MKTVKKFAEEKGISESRVKILIQQKRIKAVKFGSQWNILYDKILKPKKP